MELEKSIGHINEIISLIGRTVESDTLNSEWLDNISKKLLLSLEGMLRAARIVRSLEKTDLASKELIIEMRDIIDRQAKALQKQKIESRCCVETKSLGTNTNPLVTKVW